MDWDTFKELLELGIYYKHSKYYVCMFSTTVPRTVSIVSIQGGFIHVSSLFQCHFGHRILETRSIYAELLVQHSNLYCLHQEWKRHTLLDKLNNIVPLHTWFTLLPFKICLRKKVESLKIDNFFFYSVIYDICEFMQQKQESKLKNSFSFKWKPHSSLNP